MASRLEIQQRVQANLQRVGVTTAENTAVQTWIDQVIREDICADHSWSGMEFTRTRNTVAGTDTYAWANPTVFKDCRYIMLQRSTGEDYFLLQEITLDALTDRRWFTEQQDNTPRAWARDADSYVLRPIPDAIYPVRERVWEYPAALATDGASNFATLYNPRLVELGVTTRACLYYGEVESYQAYLAAYQNELAKAVGIDRKRLSPAKMTIKPSAVAGMPEPGLPAGIDLRLQPYGWKN